MTEVHHDLRSHLFCVSLAAVLVAAMAPVATAQISPGDLSRAHEDLEGVRNCTQCHSGGGGSVESKCLACHEGVAYLREEGRGLHAREAQRKCSKCHPEHAGRDFDLIEWADGSSRDFDHGRAGWPLDGAHAKQECRACHQPTKQARNITLRMRSKHVGESWMGLQPNCKSCHSDVHANRLGSQCDECHAQGQWRADKNFDHARTGYVLAGKHADVECAKCHENGRFATSDRANAKWVLSGLATEDCGACHQDVHGRRFGKTCSQCHVVQGFRVVSQATFDHGRTRYPLRGAHRKVKCVRCHDETKGGWGRKPSFESCESCHADAHRGTATLAGRTVDCDACHSAQGFKTSTYDLVSHAASRYPLEGKHRQVECAKCHRSSPKQPDWGSAGVQLRPAADSCASCHLDIHAGQIEGDALRCDRCHDLNGFRPSIFDAAAHDRTAFPLVGAHLRVKCERCHAARRPGLPDLDRTALGSADFAFRSLEKDCAACHVDVHRGRYGEAAARERRMNCVDCHTFEGFRPSLVDVRIHRNFAFSLEGAHRATPCFLCHPKLTAPRLTSTLILGPDSSDRRDYSGVPTACEDCHTRGIPR